jgi:hypothetical protein
MALFPRHASDCVPRLCHYFATEMLIELDSSNRIVLTAGFARGSRNTPRVETGASSTPGRIALEVNANTSGEVIKSGKLKDWTGAVPATPIEDAVDQARSWERSCKPIPGMRPVATDSKHLFARLPMHTRWRKPLRP